MVLSAAQLLMSLVALVASAEPNTFGTNDRVQITTPTGALKMIGQLNGPIGRCMASLVGPHVILTAYHCFARAKDDGEPRAGHYRFTLSGGGTAQTTRVWLGDKASLVARNRRADWAIALIDADLGDPASGVGHFGVSEIWDLFDPRSSDLRFAGYGAAYFGGGLSEQKRCGIQQLESDGQGFLHDCDISPGDSGGPIFSCGDDGAFRATQGSMTRSDFIVRDSLIITIMG